MMIVFEWDDAKASANLRKHGISFESATLVFDDPDLVMLKDQVVDGEQRWQAIGSARGAAILLVVHTVNEHDDEDEIIRIISARPATRHEALIYQSTHN